MDWTLPAEQLGRVALAASLGVILGAERERRGHDAGTRTFALLCTGSALFTVASTSGFDRFGASVDATRIASQVVVGVGFLGAGLIFRQGHSVQNLTTAAALWATAAVGVAAGTGQASLAVGATALLLVLLMVEAEALLRRLPGRPPRQRLVVRLAPDASAEALRARIDPGRDLELSGWHLAKADGQVVIRLDVRADDPAAMDRLTHRLVHDRAVHGLEVQR